MRTFLRTTLFIWVGAVAACLAGAADTPIPMAGRFLPGQMEVSIAQVGAEPVISWRLEGDRGVVGFNVLRAEGQTGEFIQANTDFLYVAGDFGGSHQYRDVPPGTATTVSYQVELVFTDGSRARSETVTLPMVPAVAPARTVSEQPRYVAIPVEEGPEAAALAETAATEIRRAVLARSQNTGARIKITVKEPGLYRLDAATLAARFGAGTDEVREWIGQDFLRLSSQGVKCSWIPDAANDGIFFFNPGYEDVFTFHNVFWLERDTSGLVIPAVEGDPPGAAYGPMSITQTNHFEMQRTQQYHGLDMVELDDYWFWMKMQAPTTSNLFFELSQIDFQASEATLNLRLQGGSDNAHHVNLSINGTAIGQALWTSYLPNISAYSFPVSVLSNGNNRISLQAVLDPGVTASAVFLDHFSVTYRMRAQAAGNYLQLPVAETPAQSVTGFTTSDICIAEILDSRRIREVKNFRTDPGEGGTFAVSFTAATSGNLGHVVCTPAGAKIPLQVEGVPPSALRATTNHVDYLLITHPILAEESRRLADFRAGQIPNLQARTILVDDIYDEFSWGLKTPHAIRRFLAYAAANWTAPLPHFVLLAGSSSIDYKNYLNYNGCLVPMVFTDTIFGPYSADNLLADVAGDDGVPDFALGRIPANTAVQMSNCVNKVITNETAALRPPVLRAFVFADNPDGAGDFQASADRVADLMPADYTVTKSYLSTTYSATRVRRDTSNAFHAGTSLMAYFGHSAWDKLAGEGVFRNADVLTLTNSPVFPIALLGTCWASRHEWPGSVNHYFGKPLMLATNKGALATWGPSGEAFNSHHEIMTTGFLNIHEADRSLRLGDVGRLAIQQAATSSVPRFHIETMTLMGDPLATIW